MEFVGVVSLGCSKNKVDTEIMLGILTRAGFSITNDTEKADVLIVNTCGFIESAKQESIDTILELAHYKTANCKKLVVTGCLSQRYGQELAKELPEVDIFLGVDQYRELPALLGKNRCSDTMVQLFDRKIVTTGHYAYLRIADGCDNRCSYCAIPTIRGPYKSRLLEDILVEARTLRGGGVRELIVIAQDTTRYGWDIYGKPMLIELLKQVAGLGFDWVRVLYAYPGDEIDQLAGLICSDERIVNYIDMPIQHCDEDILARMNRRGGGKDLERQVKALKQAGITVRTSFITGFPGETQTQFERLLEFVNTCEFDRAGVFMYSQEDGTPASDLDEQVNESVKQLRYDALMQAQMQVSLKINASRVGRTYMVLIDGKESEQGPYYGRSYAEAPEVDGLIFINADELRVGEYYNVRITGATEYDLLGELHEYPK